jgi:hypothetical protein
MVNEERLKGDASFVIMTKKEIIYNYINSPSVCPYTFISIILYSFMI